MSQMLASDDQNPNFVGARNPDASLHVQFYEELVKNNYQSEQQKKPVFESHDFVCISIPGQQQLTVTRTYANDDHKRRFPRQWQAYKERAGSGEKIIGTPTSEWPRLSKHQVEELRVARFYTVEAIANASDAQLSGIGMIAGQSAFTFRDDAKRFLMVASADAKLSEADETLRKAKEEAALKEELMMKEITSMKEAADAMKAQMAELLAMATKNNEATTSEQPTRGRPRKTEAESA